MKNQITINRLFTSIEEFKIVPLHRKRDWMAETNSSFAYRCIPLNIANDYGWAVLSPAGFTASWNGMQDKDAVQVYFDGEEAHEFADSHFGHGILTINVDFLVQTPVGVSTYIRGIPNELIDGLQPLDAIVETDWLPFTFTYNYKFTRPCKIRFEKEEPLFSFFPINRGEIEGYSIRQRSIYDDPELAEKYRAYGDSRDSHLKKLESGEIESSAQAYYSNAKDPEGNKYEVVNHTKRVSLRKIDE